MVGANSPNKSGSLKVSPSAASLLRRAKSRWSLGRPDNGSEVRWSSADCRASVRLRSAYAACCSEVVSVSPSGVTIGVGGVYPNSGVSGLVSGAAGASLSRPSCARRALRPIVMSTIKLASAPTPAPYAPSSPEPTRISCWGSYTPLAIRFCAIFCAASVAPSMPPRAAAVTIKLLNGLIAGASISNRPVGAPSRVAVARSSPVAPLASAASRASPAPAATPRPPAAMRPANPNGPAAKNGSVEPKPSLSLRVTESS